MARVPNTKGKKGPLSNKKDQAPPLLEENKSVEESAEVVENSVAVPVLYEAMIRISRSSVVGGFDSLLKNARKGATNLDKIEKYMLDENRLKKSTTDELAAVYRAVNSRYQTELSAATRLVDVSIKDPFVRSYMGLTGDVEDEKKKEDAPEITPKQKQAMLLLDQAAARKMMNFQEVIEVDDDDDDRDDDE